MKLKSVKMVEEFRAVIRSCKGNVFLKSEDGDIFNLKSSLSEYIALGRLISEAANNLELYADDKEDEAMLIKFLSENN